MDIGSMLAKIDVAQPGSEMNEAEAPQAVSEYHQQSLALTSPQTSRQEWSQVGLSSVVQMVTLDESEVNYDDPDEKDEETSPPSAFKRFWGNVLCPLCGVYRWNTKTKLAFDEEISTELRSHIIYIFNTIFYFFSNRIGPDIKFLAEELFFKTGQVEADGLCAISAQIWAATYLLQKEVNSMTERDVNEIRNFYLDLVWESEKAVQDVRNFYKFHQEFKKAMYFHLNTIGGIIGSPEELYPDLDPPVDLKKIRKLDRLFVNEELLLENTLTLIVSNSKEEPRKFDKFADDYRIKIIKHFLSASTVSAIVLGRAVIRENTTLLKTHRLPQLFTNKSAEHPKLAFKEGMESLEKYLNTFFDEVQVPSSVKNDLIDWVDTIRDLTDQYAIYGEWVSDKLNEIRDMSQLCYEFADKICWLELPTISSIRNTLVMALKVANNVDSAIKPDLQDCETPPHQRSSIGEKYRIDNKKLEYFYWKDFYCTEYHAVLTRLPLVRGSTEFIFFENKLEIS